MSQQKIKENQLLSKVIDEQNFYVLHRFSIDRNDFPTLGNVYDFIKDYVKSEGTTPDYRDVVAKFSNFEYEPEIVSTFSYLCKGLKSQTAKRQSFELLQNQAGKKFKELQGDEFVKWLREEAERIEAISSSAFELGTNYAVNGDERKTWYEEAKETRTGQYIPTPYAGLTKALGGGFELGDYMLLMAFTNVGKSWISSHVGLVGWLSGFGVLHYSPELSKRQQSLRLDTLNGHFNNVELRRGILGNEANYLEYLEGFNAEKETAPYIIKTMEDLPNGLTVEQIEADLQMFGEGQIGMVIIDGFNLMIHTGGKGMRDGMTSTSRKLRQIFGRYKVAGVVVHQTNGQSAKENREDEDGMRVVKPPSITHYSETIATIQDASTVLTFDQADGIGKLSIEKAREPSVGQLIELSCDFNMGYIREQDLTSLF
jgi:replicative DNA helicase